MIVNLKTAYPIVLMIVTVILVKLYPITPAFAKTMRAELKQRRRRRRKIPNASFSILSYILL